MTTAQNYKFKLLYFEDRGKADLIKLLFSCAPSDLSFEVDYVQIKQSEFNLYMTYMPFQQLPVLIVNDHLKIAQTNTICRFLAAYFKLNGHRTVDDEESVVACDMIVEQLKECADQAVQCMQHELDNTRRISMLNRFLNDTLPKTLSGYEKMLSLASSKYIVGSSLSWADLAMVNAWEWLDETSRQLLTYYPLVSAHNEFIRSLPQVHAWFKTQRPLRVLKKA